MSVAPSESRTEQKKRSASGQKSASRQKSVSRQKSASRQKKVLALLAEQSDRRHALLITETTNVRYLTGFTGDSTALLLWSDGRTPRALAISDGRFATQLDQQCEGLETVIREPSTTMPDVLGEQIAAIDRPVMVESATMTVDTFAKLEQAIDTHAKKGHRCELVRSGQKDPVRTVRQVKDAEEIAAIRDAIRAAEGVFAYLQNRISPDISEFDLAADGEHVARQFGMLGWSFPAIVACGPAAALPHYEPGDRRMGDDSHVLIDWGVRGRDGYCSDMTRVLLRRKTPKRLDAIYDAVLKAHRAALAAIRPGVTGDEVDSAARRVLEDAGYGKRFSHSLGHGLGLNVHEAPGLRPGSEDTLAAGMVVTVEPGVYLPDYGGVRLEDDVLVTEDGAESLCRLPLEADAMRLDW